mgnify:CR=1 FL=1
MSKPTTKSNEVTFVNTSNPSLGTKDKPHYVPNIKLSTSDSKYIFPAVLQPEQVAEMMAIRTEEAEELSKKLGKPQKVKFIHDKGVYYAGTRTPRVNETTGEVFFTCVYKSKERNVTQRGIVL